MISACLVLMFCLALFRQNSLLKPSWLATLSGALSISTWGFLGVSTIAMDGLIGGSNWITLVRDMFATLSFWFYREAVARATQKRPVGAPRPSARGLGRIPWLLLTMIAAYAVPFWLIQDKGVTSPRFVLDRLHQPAVWLFAVLYMCGLIFLSLDALRMLRRARGLLRVVSIGYALVVLGCTIEAVYLTLAHQGFGGDEFRVSMYFASELPFFTGIFAIGAAIAWNAMRIWARYRWSLAQLLDIALREKQLDISAFQATYVLLGSIDPRQKAFRLMIAIQSRLEETGIPLSAAASRRFAKIQRRFSSPRIPDIEEDVIRA